MICPHCILKHSTSSHDFRHEPGVSKWPKMPKIAILVILTPLKYGKNVDYRWCAFKRCSGISRAYQKWFEKEFGLKIPKKWQNFEFSGISFVFSFNFLYKVGPFRGGVKWPSNSLKFFSRTFYDISAQKKKSNKILKKCVFLVHPNTNPSPLFLFYHVFFFLWDNVNQDSPLRER